MSEETRVYTQEEVAKRFGVTPRTVSSWLKQGKLTGSRPGKSWIITEKDITDMLERTRNRPRDE